MSVDVWIVIPPISKNDDEAWKQADQLCELEKFEKGSAPEVFKLLYDQLVERHPCICSLNDQADPRDGVWSDGPLWNNFGKRVAMLGMVSTGSSAIPFIIERANALGLVVFDPQIGAIYRGDAE